MVDSSTGGRKPLDHVPAILAEFGNQCLFHAPQVLPKDGN